MRITLQLVKSHFKQPIPAIVLTVDSQKYLFNVNESYQRFFRQHSQKISKGTKIFVSQLSTDHISGLFGLLLTFQEQGFTENMQIYGPPGLSSYFLNIFFLNEKWLTPFSVYDFCNNHTKILGTNSKELMEKADQEQVLKTISFNINDFLAKELLSQMEAVNDPQTFIQNNSFYKDKFLEIHPIHLSDQKASLCYIIKPNKIPGRVNPEKLKAENIKSIYLKTLFEKGELEVNGKIYYAKDFKESDEPSPIAIIIDCSNVENLERLFKEPKLMEFYANKIDLKENDLKLMVHIVPIGILTDKRYQDFLTNFQSSCQHIFASEEIHPGETTLLKPPYKHFTFNNIFANYFPNHFPVLQETRSEDYSCNLEDLFPLISKKATYQKLVEYVVSPSKHEGFAALPDPHEKNSSQIKFKENNFFVNKYNKWLQAVKSPSASDRPFLDLFAKCDPELVFLGVQSMLHSSHCNVSGMYLKFGQHNDTGILMDCGEGSYLQLLTHYGIEEVKIVLKNLKVIYITHYHSDHNTGIFQVMKEREKITSEPLYLIVPFNCGPWVLKHSQIIETLNYKIVFNQHLASPISSHKAEEFKIDSEQETKFGSYQDDKLYQDLNQLEKDSIKSASEFQGFLSKELGVIEFKSVGVDHIPQSYALYIKHQVGWSFLYSGDTRPSESMVQEVGDVTILVHESTFADDLKEQAKARMHSTDKEAIEIGIKLKAWRTILTHYSQRYTGRLFQQTDEKELAEYFKEYAAENVVRSWDHLGFKFSELHHLPALNRCMQVMFNETQSSKNKFL